MTVKGRYRYWEPLIGQHIEYYTACIKLHDNQQIINIPWPKQSIQYSAKIWIFTANVTENEAWKKQNGMARKLCPNIQSSHWYNQSAKIFRTTSGGLTLPLFESSAVNTWASTYTKSGGDHGQNIDRMPIWGIRTTVVTKNLHQANTVVSQYLNTYRSFTSNTDWNMTHNQTKSSHMSRIGGKIMQKNCFPKSGGHVPMSTLWLPLPAPFYLGFATTWLAEITTRH